MEISTEVKNYIIIFKDRSIKWITEKTAEALFRASASASKTVALNGSLYDFNSIAKIISKEEYYDQYPKERPEETPEWKKEEYVSISQIADRSTNSLAGILKGLKQYIDGQLEKGITPHNAISLYEEKLKKYKQRIEERKELEALVNF